jgi:hypothetical protein
MQTEQQKSQFNIFNKVKSVKKHNPEVKSSEDNQSQSMSISATSKMSVS